MLTVLKNEYGNPIETEAVTADVPSAALPAFLEEKEEENGISLHYEMAPEDIVYGLGESMRGINKRGWEYIQDVLDDPEQTEDRRNLYGAHNFLIVDGKKPFGIFVDDPGKVRFDVGYTRQKDLQIDFSKDAKVYTIEGGSAEEIAKAFRKMIGKSYVPPKFAFGYGQSRWGYGSKEDLRTVVKGLKENQIPVDMVYMDIDYMQDYKDFTLKEGEFDQDFPAFVQEMKEQNIHLVPIIDAGVKKEAGYSTYDEGVSKGYFAKLEDHQTDFVGAVWPGYAVFPDFLNKDARNWFGMQYKILTDAGIDAFWNDMNEPALFYSEHTLKDLVKFLEKYVKDPDAYHIFQLGDEVRKIKNSPEDYKRFYHNMDGNWVRHDKVHNLYGYNMTRAAKEAFEKLRPDERTLLFSRASYIGAHRYGGIWSGDNKSWYSHILLMLQQLPGLNMSGFLFTGCDLGGFGADSTRDLVLRFTQLGVFTPLMRNHSALGTREQEPYQFEHPEDFANIISVRYRLIPYLYSEFMKAAENDEMMFRPLAFVYPDDSFARKIEDQLMLGDEIMIAPVYAPNAEGRYVYLPEEMKEIRFRPDGQIKETVLDQGHHWVAYASNEVVFFIRKNKTIPLAAQAKSVPEINMESIEMIGYPGSYLLYDDDGISLHAEKSLRELKKEA